MLNKPLIVFEDDYLLVINKPAGMVVNQSATIDPKLTLQYWIRERYPRIYNKKDNSAFYERKGIVHRLDKETSGLLIIAKDPQVFTELQAQFKLRQVTKNYLCLVHGKVNPEKGSVDAPLARNRFDREKFGVFLGGREAKTDYQVIAFLRGQQKPIKNQKLDLVEIIKPDLWTALIRKIVYPEEGNNREYEYFTFLLITPKTGRTHQIRVHFKYLYHPLVADEKYAGRKNAQHDLKWCPRHFLHAYKLSFKHPITNKIVEFVASLPDDLKNTIRS